MNKINEYLVKFEYIKLIYYIMATRNNSSNQSTKIKNEHVI